jgi:uncharacterized protein
MTPKFRLLANDSDITSLLNLESSRIEFTDESGDVSDEISLVFEGAFKRPKYEDELKLWIGTKENGLFYCGLFLVQTSKYKDGAKKQIEVRATAADFSKGLKVKRSQTYENISITKVCELIAKRNELQIKSDFDDIFISHLEQTNESDLHFLKRISKDYNALFSIKNNSLVFLKKIKEGQKADSLPRFSLIVDDLIDISIESSNKTSYNSCKAIWRDTKDNTQKSVIVGDGEPTKIIKDSFENTADAKTKALAHLQKANSGTKVGTISCDGFVLFAGGVLSLSGTYEDDGEYEIKKAHHTIDESGWKVSIEIEN